MSLCSLSPRPARLPDGQLPERPEPTQRTDPGLHRRHSGCCGPPQAGGCRPEDCGEDLEAHGQSGECVCVCTLGEEWGYLNRGETASSCSFNCRALPAMESKGSSSVLGYLSTVHLCVFFSFPVASGYVFFVFNLGLCWENKYVCSPQAIVIFRSLKMTQT